MVVFITVVGMFLIAAIQYLIILFFKKREIAKVEAALPKPGSLFIHAREGMSWGTTSYGLEQKIPTGYPKFDLWFKPGSKWLVLNSGKAPAKNLYFVDVFSVDKNQIFRIFENEYAILNWSDGSLKMICECETKHE